MATSDDMRRLSREPDAECPACQRRMAPMDRKPIVSTDCLVDVTYICEWCGMEAKRAVRDQLKLSDASGARQGM
jgi:DNA-directed RNA polymerase subunit RPC12/RpoP